MATADLLAELNKDTFKLDADSEKKLTSMLLKLLQDTSNQVQELVVKWCAIITRPALLTSRSLGPFSKRVKEQQLQEILDTLCGHLLNDKKGADELRDISGIALKTVIFEVPTEPPTNIQLLINRVTPKLIQGISANVPLEMSLTNCFSGGTARNCWLLPRCSE